MLKEGKIEERWYVKGTWVGRIIDTIGRSHGRKTSVRDVLVIEGWSEATLGTRNMYHLVPQVIESLQRTSKVTCIAWLH